MDWIEHAFYDQHTSLEVLFVIVGLFFLYWVLWFLLPWLQKTPLFRSKNLFCLIAVRKVILPPLKVVFFVWGCYFSLLFIASFFPLDPWLYVMKIVRDGVTILSFSWMAYQWKTSLFQEKVFLQKNFPTPGLAQAVNKLVSMVIVLFSVLMILRLFQIDIVPLLAFGGIGAAALGFAAKDVMGNFFGGVMLSITQPFVSGDQILLPTQGIEGEVEEVGWYLTCIRDKEKRPLYFPNALFSQGLVINLSRMTHRRIKEIVHLQFQEFDRVIGVTASLRDAVRKCSQVDSTLPVLVYLERIGEYSLEICLEAYTLEKEFERYLQVKEEIVSEMLALFEQEGLELSYPVSSVQLTTNA